MEQHTNLDVLPDNDLQIMMISAFLSPLFKLSSFVTLDVFLFCYGSITLRLQAAKYCHWHSPEYDWLIY